MGLTEWFKKQMWFYYTDEIIKNREKLEYLYITEQYKKFDKANKRIWLCEQKIKLLESEVENENRNRQNL